jgi:hypothetical protein
LKPIDTSGQFFSVGTDRQSGSTSRPVRVWKFGRLVARGLTDPCVAPAFHRSKRLACTAAPTWGAPEANSRSTGGGGNLWKLYGYGKDPSETGKGHGCKHCGLATRADRNWKGSVCEAELFQLSLEKRNHCQGQLFSDSGRVRKLRPVAKLSVRPKRVQIFELAAAMFS